MARIPQVPENVRSAVASQQDEVLWSWVEGQLSAQVLAEAGGPGGAPLLVRVGQGFDFGAMAASCAGYHVYAGKRGQAPVHRIGCLCRALVVRWLYGWSYVRTVREVRSNRLVRWFVGLRLHEEGFSVATLWRFEQWVKRHQPRLFFNEVLRQIERDFATEREAAQVGDTFGLWSQVRAQTRTELLRGAGQRLLDGLAGLAGEQLAVVLAGFDQASLFGATQETPEYWLEKRERDAREEATALAAQRLLVRLTPLLHSLPQQGDVVWRACAHRLQVLGKILADEFDCTFDEQGQCVAARLRDQQTHGAFRLGSIHDEEATFRHHGKQSALGYNISVAATTNFVREIAAATGATPDSAGVARLIAAQAEHLGLVPPKLVYDRGAGMPKVFAEVEKASGGRTQLVARLIAYGKNRTRFGPQDFTLDEHGMLTCPNGQQSSIAYRAQGGDGWTYRFLPEQCQGCPLWEKCRGDQVKPNRYRQVFISDYRYQQRQALAYIGTDAYKQDMKLRPHIERIIAALVRYNGARRAKARGLANADFQARMAACAFNLKRWAKLQQQEEKDARRRAKPPDEG